MIGNENPTVLRIERNPVRIRETRGIPLQQPKRGVILLRILFEHDHGAVVLESQEHLLRCFVDGYDWVMPANVVGIVSSKTPLSSSTRIASYPRIGRKMRYRRSKRRGRPRG